MDYRDEVFMAVAQKLSFSKAAQALFISQPAVTKHIKELELKLQTTLFERKGNKIYLTPSGDLCYRRLQVIEEHYQDLTYELGRINQIHRGCLHIGASSTIAQYVIPEVLASFHERYPDIQLHLHNGNSDHIIHKLQQHELDIALVENKHTASDIRYLSFLDDEIIAVASPEQNIARQKGVLISDLPHIPLVLREEGSGSLEVIQQCLSKHLDISSLSVAIHLGSTEAIKNFLPQFNGIAFVSERSVRRELASKHLVQLPINDLQIMRQFRFAMRQGHQQQLSELFRHFLLQYDL
ncbi:MAG: LysR substrate-binding domain-containing protein [Mangrovibacterium sp.]